MIVVAPILRQDYQIVGLHFMGNPMLMRTTFRTLIFLALLLSANVAHSEPEAISQATDLKCLPGFPNVASVTDLSTGKGVRLMSVDQAADQVPPCSGNLPSQGIIVGEFPLSYSLPTLAKIRSNMGQCSGNFISPTAVMTAAHCIFDQATKKYAQNVQILPGYQNGPQLPGCQAYQVLTFNGYTAAEMAAHDIAVLKTLGDCLPPQYGFFGLSAFNVQNCGKEPFPQKDYSEPHYSPRINNNETQAQAFGQIVGCVQGMIVTRLPLEPGSSGSAVLDGFSRAAFAVHSQYSLTPAASYNAVMTKAKICVIQSFLNNDENTANCTAGN